MRTFPHDDLPEGLNLSWTSKRFWKSRKKSFSDRGGSDGRKLIRQSHTNPQLRARSELSSAQRKKKLLENYRTYDLIFYRSHDHARASRKFLPKHMDYGNRAYVTVRRDATYAEIQGCMAYSINQSDIKKE